jgi:glutamine cyclotransferase
LKTYHFIFRLVAISITSATISCSNPSTDRNTGNQVNAITFKVIKTYPHDTGYFTEGLLYDDNQLFESTGSPDEFPNARSVFGIVDLKTGKIDIKAELDRNFYFGEGIVILDKKLFQVTYKNQKGFIYDLKTFKETGTFEYSNKEGWGLTTDGRSIIMSDGTGIITFFEPDSMKVIKSLDVTFNGASAMYLNELEFINGYIYANIWTTNNIAKIDTLTGKIVGILDLTSLFAEARKQYPQTQETNGIAWDSSGDRIFITGKFWPEIYQIKFPH